MSPMVIARVWAGPHDVLSSAHGSTNAKRLVSNLRFCICPSMLSDGPCRLSVFTGSSDLRLSGFLRPARMMNSSAMEGWVEQ